MKTYIFQCRFMYVISGDLKLRYLRFQSCCWAKEFQLPTKMFYCVEVWRLAGRLQDLEMLLTESLLSFPCCVFWFIAQNLMIHGPIHPMLNMVQLSC